MSTNHKDVRVCHTLPRHLFLALNRIQGFHSFVDPVLAPALSCYSGVSEEICHSISLLVPVPHDSAHCLLQCPRSLPCLQSKAHTFNMFFLHRVMTPALVSVGPGFLHLLVTSSECVIVTVAFSVSQTPTLPLEPTGVLRRGGLYVRLFRASSASFSIAHEDATHSTCEAQILSNLVRHHTSRPWKNTALDGASRTLSISVARASSASRPRRSSPCVLVGLCSSGVEGDVRLRAFCL